MYSPLWKIIHQDPSVSCTPPFEKWRFLVGVYFGVGVYFDKCNHKLCVSHFLFLNRTSLERAAFSVYGILSSFLFSRGPHYQPAPWTKQLTIVDSDKTPGWMAHLRKKNIISHPKLTTIHNLHALSDFFIRITLWWMRKSWKKSIFACEISQVKFNEESHWKHERLK